MTATASRTAKKPTTLRTGTASKTGNKTNNFARASHFFVNLFVVVTHKTFHVLT